MFISMMPYGHRSFMMITLHFLSYPFQAYNGRIRTICGVDSTGELLERDMMPKLGMFHPCQLVYFSQLTLIDISGCTTVVPQDFIECIQICQRLINLNMSGCYQFHEYQMVRMLCELKTLQIVDITGTKKLLYVSAYRIVTSLLSLKHLSLDPKFPTEEGFNWRWLITDVKNRLRFGEDVMAYFPPL